MALIKLNINSFKKDLGGISNKLIDGVINEVENKLENAVENLISKSLKKVGLSNNIAGDIASRFGDAFAKGNADKYFKEFSSEVSRVSPEEMKANILPAGDVETYTDSITRATNNADIGGSASSTIQFPSQLGKYYMVMKFAEYVRPSPETQATLNFKQAFALPVPRELKEQFTIDVSEQPQGLAGGVANIMANAFGTGNGVGQTIKDQAGAMMYSAAVQALGSATSNEVGQVFAQFGGAIPNPHVSAVFSGIPLRHHRFDWTFAPRNKQESADLQKLIFALKAYSLPSYSRMGTAALQYPMLCRVDFFPWKNLPAGEGLIKGGEFIFKIKDAILTSVDINYSPQGMPSFFEGTSLPTMISLSLEFIETEIHTGNTYGRQGDSNADRQMEKINQALKDKGIDLSKTVDDITKLFS